MSCAKFSMRLDEKTRIIYQYVEGVLDDDDSAALLKMTKTFAEKLEDRHKVRILVVSNEMGKATSKARKSLLMNMQDPDLYKIAVMGKNQYMKTLFSFILKVTGIKKTRVFTDEQEAVRWLCE